MALNITGKVGWWSGSVNVAPSQDADALAFITAANITDTTQKSAINTLVTQLKTYGIWTKMKALYPFVGGTASSHKFNLKDPRDLDAAFRLTFSGGWTHSSTGALPNGTNAYADTFLAPQATLSQNSTHISYYSRTDNNVGIEMGARYPNTNPSQLYLSARNSGLTFGRVNSLATEGLVANNDGRGFYLFSRTNSSGYESFKNTTKTSITQTSNSIPNLSVTIGGYYANLWYYSSKESAFASIGDGLTDTEAANFYTAVQTFQSTLGRQVGVPIVADTDAQAFLNAAVITNQTQANAINTLVTDLKSANIWTKMKAIYPFVGGTATTHKFNLKDPRDLDAAYRLTFSGGWTHSSTGALPNGTTAYASLGSLNMNTISPSDYSLGLYSRTNGGNSNWYDFGATNNVDTGWFILNTRTAANTINYQAGSINKSVSNTNSQGFYQAGATSNNLTKIWKNGVVIGTDSTTQTKTPFNQIFEIGRGTITTGGGYYSNREQGLFYISTGLTDAEIVSVRTAVYNYQNALGRLAE